MEAMGTGRLRSAAGCKYRLGPGWLRRRCLRRLGWRRLLTGGGRLIVGLLFGRNFLLWLRIGRLTMRWIVPPITSLARLSIGNVPNARPVCGGRFRHVVG